MERDRVISGDRLSSIVSRDDFNSIWFDVEMPEQGTNERLANGSKTDKNYFSVERNPFAHVLDMGPVASSE